MKKMFGFAAICICIIACLPVPIVASANSNLQIQIFPLECSFDTVDLGYVTSLGLTPEDCFPEPPQPPTVSNPRNPPVAQPHSYRFLLPHFNGTTSLLPDKLTLPQVNRLRTADGISPGKQQASRLHSWVVPTIAAAVVVATIGVIAVTYFFPRRILPHANFKPPHKN